jgi:hypothetical protein
MTILSYTALCEQGLWLFLRVGECATGLPNQQLSTASHSQSKDRDRNDIIIVFAHHHHETKQVIHNQWTTV